MTVESNKYKRSDQHPVIEAPFSTVAQSWLWDSQVADKKKYRLIYLLNFANNFNTYVL